MGGGGRGNFFSPFPLVSIFTKQAEKDYTPKSCIV